MTDSVFMYNPAVLESLYLSGNQVYGAAKHFQVERNILTVDKMKGDSGEQAVAGLLNLWVVGKEAQVFHSLGTHDGSAGETDHVVVSGKTILIVETKTFTGYHAVKVTKHGTVFGSKEHKEHKLFDNKLSRKVELYQRRFPDFIVKGLLVVAGYGMVFSTEHPSYMVCGLDRFHNVLDENMFKATVPKTTHKLAVLFFGSLCLRAM